MMSLRMEYGFDKWNTVLPEAQSEDENALTLNEIVGYTTFCQDVNRVTMTVIDNSFAKTEGPWNNDCNTAIH